jgi:uncharacterized membrane protein
MMPERPTVIAAAGAAALLAAAAEIISAPVAVRVLLGIPLVLILPGYVAMCAVLPGREISRVEGMLATLGASLAISTSASVLLAALPIGLSRASAAATLGVVTAAVAIYAWRRTRRFIEDGIDDTTHDAPDSSRSTRRSW